MVDGVDAALAAPPTAGMIVRGILVQAVGMGLGAILLGVATIRARVLPAVGGWLLIAGAVLAAVSQLTLVLRGLSVVGFAAAFITAGLTKDFGDLRAVSEIDLDRDHPIRGAPGDEASQGLPKYARCSH